MWPSYLFCCSQTRDDTSVVLEQYPSRKQGKTFLPFCCLEKVQTSIFQTFQFFSRMSCLCGANSCYIGKQILMDATEGSHYSAFPFPNDAMSLCLSMRSATRKTQDHSTHGVVLTHRYFCFQVSVKDETSFGIVGCTCVWLRHDLQGHSRLANENTRVRQKRAEVSL